jgi:hypothetical protein
MTERCPECHDGNLRTRTSRQLGPETIERRRYCSCCKYEDVALVRPAKVFKIRVVHTTTAPSPESKNGKQ